MSNERALPLVTDVCADAAYITVAEGESVRQTVVGVFTGKYTETLILDFAEDGKLLGIELLHASALLPEGDLA